jgi:hypothetical protein
LANHGIFTIGSVTIRKKRSGIKILRAVNHSNSFCRLTTSGSLFVIQIEDDTSRNLLNQGARLANHDSTISHKKLDLSRSCASSNLFNSGFVSLHSKKTQERDSVDQLDDIITIMLKNKICKKYYKQIIIFCKKNGTKIQILFYQTYNFINEFQNIFF